MADYQRKVIRRLTEAGCVRIRQGKGDHEVWFSPKNGRTFTVKSHAMRSRHTANETLKQAGLAKEF